MQRRSTTSTFLNVPPQLRHRCTVRRGMTTLGRHWVAGTSSDLRTALRSREFMAIWLAGVQSVLGDQIARVALALLVFGRTGSAALTALTYALTMLPNIIGGLVLARLADHFPRRRVMIVCDLARMALVAAMAWPSLSLPALASLVVAAQLLKAPFDGAQSASVNEVLTGRAYPAGEELRQLSAQVAGLIGFGAGGLIVVAIGPQTALLVNAVTFGVSAVLLRAGVAARPAPHSSDSATAGGRPSPWKVLGGWAVLAKDSRLPVLLGAACLAGLSTVVPEGLAAPWVAESHAPTAMVGVVMAADPVGFVLGGLVLRRFAMETRLKVFGALVVATNLLLVPYLAHPPLWVAMLLVTGSAMCSSYMITASPTFNRLVPNNVRGQAAGFARSAITAAQGAGVAVGGVLAQGLGSAAFAIGAMSAVGTVIAAVIAVSWARVAEPVKIAAMVTA